MWNTREDFEIALHNSYVELGLGDEVEKGRSLGSVLWEARDGANIIVPDSTRHALSIIDDLLSDAIFWFSGLYISILDDERDGHTPLFKAIFALAMKITQDSLVIRDLIVRGYDLQARSLLRSVGEHIDAVYFLCLHPDLCSEFIETKDEEASNRFWHRHLKKAQSVNDKKIGALIGAHLAEKFSDGRRAEGRLLSAVQHPSYWPVIVSQLTPASSDDIMSNLFGVPNDYSIRTGRYLFHNLAECAVATPIICKPIGDFIIRLESDYLASRFVRKGIPHLITMMFALHENWDAPVFQHSAELDALLKSLPTDQ